MRRASLILLLVVILVGITTQWNAARNRTQNDDVASFRTLDTEAAEKEIHNIATEKGALYAWDFLKVAYAEEKGTERVQGDPHALSHIAGKDIYAQLGSQGITVCGDLFTYGCLHGLLEEFLTRKGKSASAEIETTCANSPSPGDCMHGVGHGFHEMEGYNLAKALHACTASFKSDPDYCWEGAFMNNVPEWPEIKANDNLWYPCYEFEPKYWNACATTKPLQMERWHVDPATIANMCQKARTSTMVDACVGSFGYVLVRSTGADADTIEKECGRFGRQTQDRCLLSAVNLIASGRYDRWQETSTALCGLVSTDNRAVCNDSYGRWMQK